MKETALHLKHAAQQPAPSPGVAPGNPGKRDPNATREKIVVEADAQRDKASSKQNKGFVGKVIKTIFTKPDHSIEGFNRAIDKACEVGQQDDFVSADHMCEDLEAIIMEELRAPPESVVVEFIATHKKDRRPRLLFVTNWGLRKTRYVQIGFSMMTAPERRRT